MTTDVLCPMCGLHDESFGVGGHKPDCSNAPRPPVTSSAVYWEVWDTDSGNLLGDWPTLTEAFRAMIDIGDGDLVLGLGGGTKASTLSFSDVQSAVAAGTRYFPDVRSAIAAAYREVMEERKAKPVPPEPDETLIDVLGERSPK